MTRTWRPPLMMIAGVALVVAAMLCVQKEVQSPAFWATTESARFAALSSPPVAVPVSSMSRDALLNWCITLVGAPLRLAQPASVQRAFFLSCQGIALTAASGNQLDGGAWLLAATMSYHLGPAVDANHYLERSRQTSKHVHWLASRRVELAERLRPLLNDPAGEDADILELSESPSGIKFLASFYLRHTDFRGRLKLVFGKFSEKAQYQFVTAVGAVAP